MYDCEGVISNDANINRIYDKYVQEQMIRALDNATEYQDIVDKLKAGQPLLSNQIETLKDSLEDYFPDGFDRDQIQHVMKELYFIINSDDSYIPNLMEEYVLANCIDTMQDTINMDESLLIQMPQRDEVKTAITEYLTEECGESAEEAEEIAESRIRGIEDYSGMIDYCFYDTDFMMLDDYSAEDIVKSGVNDELGVGALEPARKRLPDGSFEYIGEPQKSDSFTFRIKI